MSYALIEKQEVRIAPPDENTFGLKVFKEAWLVNGEKKTFWRYGLPDVVQVMGLTPDGKIVAVKEFQPGVGADYFHLVGETMEEGEKPIETARRGLMEETGYESRNAELLSSILEDASRSDRIVHLVLLTGCAKVSNGEKGVAVKLCDPADFWDSLMDYFFSNPAEAHGGGNSLKLMALAFHRLNLIK